RYPWTRLQVLSAAQVLALASSASRVASADETEAVELSYAAPLACPDRASFASEVRARSRKVLFAEGDADRRFVVRVSLFAGHFSGELSIVDQHRDASERRIDGEKCDEVVSALALISALAVDPQAST